MLPSPPIKGTRSFSIEWKENHPTYIGDLRSPWFLTNYQMGWSSKYHPCMVFPICHTNILWGWCLLIFVCVCVLVVCFNVLLKWWFFRGMILFYQNGWLNHQLVAELLAFSSFWSLKDGEYGDQWFGKNMKQKFATRHSMWTCIYRHFHLNYPNVSELSPTLNDLGYIISIYTQITLSATITWHVQKRCQLPKKGKGSVWKTPKDQRNFQPATEPGQ